MADVLTDADVFGHPQTASGEPLTPQQSGYATQNAPFRDPGAAPGSATNPTYVTPQHPAAGQGNEVLPNGQVSSPVVPGTLTDADLGLDRPPVQARVSQTLGLEKGLAEPFANLQAKVGSIGWMKALDDSLSAAFPEYDAIVHSAERLAQPAMAHVAQQEAAGVQPGKLGEFGGNVADTLITPGGPATSGALSGVLLSNADDPMGVLRDAAFGMAGGKLAHGILGTLGSIVSPKIAPTAQTLLNEGVPLTMGQIKGGALHRLEDAAGSIPIVGDVIKNAHLRTIQGLNRAVVNRSLAPVGESVPDAVAPGRDAVAYAGDQLSDRYNDLIPHLTLQADPELGSDIRSIGTFAGNLPKEHATTLGRIIQQNILDKIDPQTGMMPGDALKDAESTLGLQIGRYSKSPLPSDQNLADGLKMTRGVLRDWVARKNPQAADELNRLNTGWANLAIGEDAASRLGATEGLFTPSQLAGAVRAANDTVRKRGYARGTALMQDLSDAALDRLPQTVPDSGSPYRHALEASVAAMVGKEAGMAPFIGRAGIAGAILSAPYTQTGQRTMQQILAGQRPSYAPAVAAILQRLQPPAARLGAATALGALAPPASGQTAQ